MHTSAHKQHLIYFYAVTGAQLPKALCSWSVRASVTKYVSTVSYKSRAEISPNLSLNCSWGQRWNEYVL